MEARVIHFTETLEVAHPCTACGVYFAMPSALLRMRKENKGSFYCPNGHSMSYGESESDRLRKELAAQKAETERQRQLREYAEKQITAQKAQTTKAQKQLERVANGVCPCCKRSFQNLMRHMSTKHPEFKERPGE